MKRELDGAPRGLFAAYRILQAAVVLAALVIAGGTVAGLAGRSAREAAPKGTSAAEPGASEAGKKAPPAAAARDPAVFAGIGRVRAATADPKPATVVVNVAFPYDRADAAFSEELASRLRDFRGIVRDYFASRTASELRAAEEARVKADLLDAFNARLRLGRVRELYFDDYLIVD